MEPALEMIEVFDDWECVATNATAWDEEELTEEQMCYWHEISLFVPDDHTTVDEEPVQDKGARYSLPVIELAESFAEIEPYFANVAPFVGDAENTHGLRGEWYESWHHSG